MHLNSGISNEKQIVESLNQKTYQQLTHNLKFQMKEIFGTIDENEVFESGLVGDYQKPDIFVKYKNVTIYISIKSGSSNVVHQELLELWLAYLRNNGIDEETIETILLYHYGDGTIDGSGKERMPYEELNYRLMDRIKKANIVLNKDKDFVKKTIERCVFKGSRETNIEADYIYHGSAEYGCLMNKKQIFKHVNYRTWEYMSHLHIGPMLFRPHARYIGDDIKNEYSRKKVDVSWPRLEKDIRYISERYDG